MTRFDVISADSHFVEPPDLWTTYVDPRFRDRVPHIRSLPETDIYWIGEDVRPTQIGMVGGAGRTGRDVRPEGRFDQDIPKAAYDVEARLEAITADGVQAEVLYPSVGARLYALRDEALMYACLEGYNNWAADWASQDREHFRVLGVVADNVDWGTRELIRCKELGLAGAIIPMIPDEGIDYAGREFDRFWDAAQETGLPISLHTATPRNDKLRWSTGSSSIGMGHIPVMRALADLIFGGVFMRFPELKVLSAENDCGWAAHFVNKMDYSYRQSYVFHDWPIKEGDLLPSDYFHRNVFMTFMDDRAGVLTRELVGVDNLLWASDYPHHQSTWPHSQQVIEEHFPSTVPAGDKHKIVAGNAARLYGFN